MNNAHSHRPLSSICECEHFVQLYDNDAELIKNLKSFIGGGLVAEDPCLIIATAAHRNLLEKELARANVNVKTAEASGAYIYLDAQETLNEFMIQGMPDDELFKEQVGNILETMSPKGKIIRVYGEMVALLWNQGNHAAALKLEKLWNDLSKMYTFTLFCAYPKSYFQESLDLTRVNLLHSTSVSAA